MSRPLKITEIPYPLMEVGLKKSFRAYLTSEDAPTYRRETEFSELITEVDYESASDQAS